MDILQNIQLWVALATGGVGVKVADAVLNARRRRTTFDTDEKDSLRKDIDYLRGQIDELRAEIADLRAQLEQREQEVSVWQRRYWSKKLVLDRVMLEVEHSASEDLKDKVKAVSTEEEE